MFLSSILAAGLFALPGLAAPTKVVGSWTLSSFRRSCALDGSVCTYSFFIDENSGLENTAYCAFPVTGHNGVPGNHSDFTAMDCDQSGTYDRFKVNGGWDPAGFATIVVTDTQLDCYAFFGYAESELATRDVAAPKTSPAFTVGTFDDNDIALAKLAARQDYQAQVLNLVRSWNPETKTISMTFTIDEGNGLRERCQLNIDNADPKGYFWSVPCGTGYTISWGYKEDTDGAVMTVCVPGKRNAWFGWDGINSRTQLGDSPKSNWYERNCW
ncbi:hypothetical protein B0T22DRAFT_537757 [Podospora appendiculata]|uniref:AA1-like domain-containing protein n=1 Tax=Podospora appendiculata TaxID=314037 RepID=A0AAE0X5W5_9PEZI|nr:hypothetical protein B0T22DRAFT_537757 [Podospora appendiculata]